MSSTKPIFSEKTVKAFRFKTMSKLGFELEQSVGFKVKHALIYPRCMVCLTQANM